MKLGLTGMNHLSQLDVRYLLIFEQFDRSSVHSDPSLRLPGFLVKYQPNCIIHVLLYAEQNVNYE